MIRQTLLHLPGIGPKRAIALQEAGVNDWRAILEQPPPARMGPATWARVVAAAERCEQALAGHDLHFLVKTLARCDHWRILAEYFDQASYFDIETSGLDYDSYITTIACYHRGSLHTFVRGENLDEFLDLLDDVRLLVSFCGTTFDVPRVESAFRIPHIPCPHIDLRWVCYYQQLAGGLKVIEQKLGIHRPPDLQGVDGHEAVLLWHLWENHGDSRALDTLVRYCSADTLSLELIAARLVANKGYQVTGMPGQAADSLLDGRSQVISDCFDRTWQATGQPLSARTVDLIEQQDGSLEAGDPIHQRLRRSRLLRHRRNLDT